jgi:hypothetical protein
MFKVRSLELRPPENAPAGILHETSFADLNAADIYYLSSVNRVTFTGERYRFIRERNIEKVAAARHHRPARVA